MPRRLNLPDSASVAVPDEEGRLFAPSAARNASAIATLAAKYAPHTGTALELASGTGQHVVELARAMPQLHWQPTEIEEARRQSIDAYLDAANLPNIAPATELDATAPGWAIPHGNQNLILLSNLLHLISAPEAQTLISEAAQALSPGGVLMIYGPFKRDDKLTSPGDNSFHNSLQAQDPEIGYKNDSDVLGWGTSAGLSHVDTIDMPANNLALLWQRPA